MKPETNQQPPENPNRSQKIQHEKGPADYLAEAGTNVAEFPRCQNSALRFMRTELPAHGSVEAEISEALRILASSFPQIQADAMTLIAAARSIVNEVETLRLKALIWNHNFGEPLQCFKCGKQTDPAYRENKNLVCWNCGSVLRKDGVTLCATSVPIDQRDPNCVYDSAGVCIGMKGATGPNGEITSASVDGPEEQTKKGN